MLRHDILEPSAGAARAWCLVLHGLGDSMEGWRPIVGELALPGLGVVLVEAPLDYVMGYSWYQIPGLTDPAATADGMLADVRASRARLGELMRMLAAEHAMPIERQLLMGFSQGCCIALETALRLPEAPLGVVGISGTMVDFDDLPEGLGAHARELPVLQTHGTDDQVIPLGLPEQSVARLREMGVDVDFRVYPKAHGLDPAEEVPDLRAWLGERVEACP